MRPSIRILVLVNLYSILPYATFNGISINDHMNNAAWESWYTDDIRDWITRFYKTHPDQSYYCGTLDQCIKSPIFVYYEGEDSIIAYNRGEIS